MKSNNAGYYLSSNETKELIECDISNKCTISNLSDGYFVNSLNNDVIKCINSVCNIINKGKACNENPNEVILSLNRLYYCNNKNTIPFSSSDKYYELSNIDASSKYPEVVEGSDIILLRINKYSVTQYITDSKGIINH